jgi:hypothetical protein
MLQVHAQVTQALDAQMRAEHGLSVSAYEVLMFLGEAPGRRLRIFLGRLSLTDEIVLGDIWTRFLAADPADQADRC